MYALEKQSRTSLCFQREKNIDIFVKQCDKRIFINTLKSHNWVEFVNPVTTFNDVLHYYNIGNSGVIYHLHIYFRLITGESWLKNMN